MRLLSLRTAQDSCPLLQKVETSQHFQSKKKHDQVCLFLNHPLVELLENSKNFHCKQRVLDGEKTKPAEVSQIVLLHILTTTPRKSFLALFLSKLLSHIYETTHQYRAGWAAEKPMNFN